MPAETPETRLALAALDAAAAADGLLGGAASRPAFADMYAYATDPSYRPSPAFTSMLSGSAELQHDLRRLISNLSRYELPRLAAAASGEISERTSGGIRMAITPSRAQPSQAYLNVSIEDEEAPKPSRLSLLGANGAIVHVTLPVFDGPEVQTIIETDGVAFRLFADPETEAFLA